MSVETWDLTAKVSPYLDRHMLFPLLDYTDSLIANKTVLYTQKDVAAARLDLLRPTLMVDYAIDCYKNLHGETAAIPDELTLQKDRVLVEQEELKTPCEALEVLFNDKEHRVSERKR
jgi:translation initiation factor 3 subunit E